MRHTDLNTFFGAPDPSLKLSIILPVKDEAECINETLTALKDQIDSTGEILDKRIYEVLVLVNNCTDNSYDLCLDFQRSFPEFRVHICPITLAQDIAHIGTVRKLLMDEACLRLTSLGKPRGVIVSTDGDSQVDPQWVHQIMNEMEKGVDVVAGRIIPRDIPQASKWPHLRDVNYRFLVSRLESLIDPCPEDPWPRHFQCYGPSIAVTCEMYTKVGGIKAIPFLEDEEFRKALKRVDAKIRKSPFVKIYTSSRLVGRVAFGFSVQLSQWQQMQSEGIEQIVEDFDSTLLKFKSKRILRSVWIGFKNGRFEIDQLNTVAVTLTLDLNWLIRQIYAKEYFEHLWEEIEIQLKAAENSIIRQTTISAAIAEFRSYFCNHTRVMVPVRTKAPKEFRKQVAV